MRCAVVNSSGLKEDLNLHPRKYTPPTQTERADIYLRGWKDAVEGINSGGEYCTQHEDYARVYYKGKRKEKAALQKVKKEVRL